MGIGAHLRLVGITEALSLGDSAVWLWANRLRTFSLLTNQQPISPPPPPWSSPKQTKLIVLTGAVGAGWSAGRRPQAEVPSARAPPDTQGIVLRSTAPGHLRAWLLAYPTPLTACYCAKAQSAGGPRLPADSEPTLSHPPAAPCGAIIASVHPVAAILSLRHLGFPAGGSCRPAAWLGGMDWPHSLVRGAPFSVAVLSH